MLEVFDSNAKYYKFTENFILLVVELLSKGDKRINEAINSKLVSKVINWTANNPFPPCYSTSIDKNKLMWKHRQTQLLYSEQAKLIREEGKLKSKNKIEKIRKLSESKPTEEKPVLIDSLDFPFEKGQSFPFE